MLNRSSIKRIRSLLHVVRKYRLLELIPEKTPKLKRVALVSFLLAPLVRRCSKDMPAGERLCQGLTELGPIYIKFGQLLSTRIDLLPPEIAQSLSRLQDDVEPFCGSEAKQIVEKALGEDITEHFEDFDDTPMAAASIAQVHAAKLKTGEDVVIKVLRPNVRTIINKDLLLLNNIANWMHLNLANSQRFKPREVVADYERTILNELDLVREANNAEKLRKNWADSDLLYVPKVYHDLCHEKVMVMERIYGVQISDLETLRAAGTNMQELSERGVEIFFTQVFRDSFFHADMHPGNIFVDITDPEKPRYAAIDFGIMGTLNAQDQRYLAENFLAFFNRDYYQVAKLHIDSGWVPPGTKVEDFEQAIESVCDPIFGKPLSEISFGHLLINLFQTAQKFNMEVQPQLVLLQKTLLYIEGLGRQLYPELDLWKTAMPYLENWLRERMSIKNLVKEIEQKLPYWREKFPEIPDLVYQTLKSEQTTQSLLLQQNQILEESRREQQRANKSQFYTIVGTGLIVATAVLYSQDSSWNITESVLSIAGLGCYLFARQMMHKQLD